MKLILKYLCYPSKFEFIIVLECFSFKKKSFFSHLNTFDSILYSSSFDFVSVYFVILLFLVVQLSEDNKLCIIFVTITLYNII